jgi:hypothetical protein
VDLTPFLRAVIRPFCAGAAAAALLEALPFKGVSRAFGRCHQAAIAGERPHRDVRTRLASAGMREGSGGDGVRAAAEPG